MFQFVQIYFVLDTDEKIKQIFQQFILRFKEYRSTLYNKHVKYSSRVEALDRCPIGIHPTHLVKLAAYWMSPEF